MVKMWYTRVILKKKLGFHKIDSYIVIVQPCNLFSVSFHDETGKFMVKILTMHSTISMKISFLAPVW